MSSAGAKFQVRKVCTDADWVAVRELCCRTGNNGKPIVKERWDAFADVWIGPYQRLCPEWTYVAEINSTIVGYLTGCPDSRRFEREKRVCIALPQALRALLRGKWRSLDADRRRFLRRTLFFEKGPERRFSRSTSTIIDKKYPAHLHVNVDETARGQGVGQFLIEKYSSELCRVKVPGIHVFCGPDPVAFYLRTGFVKIEEVEFASTRVHAMGLALH